MFGVEHVPQGEGEEDDEFFGNFGERAHVACVFELCHLGQIEGVEEAFALARLGDAEILEEEERAGDASVELDSVVAWDAALAVVAFEEVGQDGKEAFAGGVRQSVQKRVGQFEGLEMRPHVVVSSQPRFLAQQFAVQGVLEGVSKKLEVR